uniref:biotin--[biotin carboxyl-carrier protein] ligase n=1 Tax=Thermocrinis ruber TaxID=75906 RepID=A0A7C5SWX0_9AQUI
MIGDFMLWLEETGSTQSVLKEFSFPYGTVVVANRQREGRGRFGRKWHSEEGGLYFSFLLRVEDFKELLPLPLVVSYGVLLQIERKGFKPMLKWVNDVYISGKKVCGVLVERSKEKVVVGVGINLNQKEFPSDLMATSLYMLKNEVSEKKEFLLETLEILNRVLEEFKTFGFEKFRPAIRQRLMFLGEEVVVYSQEPVVGIFEDIDQEGSLLLRTAQGLLKFNAGEVSLRGSNIF